jgi:hypothetical protein
MFPLEELLFRNVRAPTNFSDASSPATESAARSPGQLTPRQLGEAAQIIENSARPLSQRVNEQPVSSINQDQTSINNRIKKFCQAMQGFPASTSDTEQKTSLEESERNITAEHSRYLQKKEKQNLNFKELQEGNSCEEIDCNTLRELQRRLFNYRLTIEKDLQKNADLKGLHTELMEDIREVETLSVKFNDLQKKRSSKPQVKGNDNNGYVPLVSPERTLKRLAKDSPNSLVPPSSLSSPAAKKQRGYIDPHATSAVVLTMQPNTDSSSSADRLNISDTIEQLLEQLSARQSSPITRRVECLANNNFFQPPPLSTKKAKTRAPAPEKDRSPAPKNPAFETLACMGQVLRIVDKRLSGQLSLDEAVKLLE